jgi:hypothetical protein
MPPSQQAANLAGTRQVVYNRNSFQTRVVHLRNKETSTNAIRNYHNQYVAAGVRVFLCVRLLSRAHQLSRLAAREGATLRHDSTSLIATNMLAYIPPSNRIAHAQPAIPTTLASLKTTTQQCSTIKTRHTFATETKQC